MARIFISYRRDDSAGHVGWMRSLLIQRFGADEIFHDINTIPPGVDFVEAIEQAVASCDVLLAVIGPRWLTATDTRGQRRLENPEDFVRVEIVAALDRKIRVIPVLVQDAHMPRSDELPQPLARLARRNALELRDSSWDYDVGRLIDALENVLQSRQLDALMSQLLEAEAQENWNTVIAIGEQILKIDSNHQSSRGKIVAAYNSRGNVRYEQGNPTAALGDYDQAIRLDPNFAIAYNNRGLARSAQSDIMKAIEDYDQAIRLDPNHANAYYNRARAYAAQNNRLVARQDFERAAQLGLEDAKKELAKLKS